MRIVVAALALAAMLAAGEVRAGALAPAPQIITEYDRSFIERSGAQTFGEMLDTGIIRYFFTGGRDLLILVNGRPYATTANDLDTLPLSAVERIEVLRAESLGTIGGHAAVRGAFNLVLRKDLDGFDVRTVARLPGRAGGDARQGSVVWGGEIGAGGHMTVGVDILDREEIAGSTREHSRSEWAEGGSFAEAMNVSVSGNTVFVFDTSERELRAVALGACDPAHGYTGPLSNPPGIESGDKGCGFAYGHFWWDSGSYDQSNAILNLDHPLGEHAELHVDANLTTSDAASRYAPSVDNFSIAPRGSLLDAINASAREADPAFEATGEDIFSVGHRFIGHGNRDWRTSTEEYEFSASVEGRLSEDLGYDAEISAWTFNGSVSGDTFVDAEIIREEIEEGRYDLTNPLSTDPRHLEAIEKSSLREEEDSGTRYLGARFALEGGPDRRPAGEALHGRRASNSPTRSPTACWRSGRETAGPATSTGCSGRAAPATPASALRREPSPRRPMPLAETVEVRAAARADEYDDIGRLHAVAPRG